MEGGTSVLSRARFSAKISGYESKAICQNHLSHCHSVWLRDLIGSAPSGEIRSFFVQKIIFQHSSYKSELGKVSDGRLW